MLGDLGYFSDNFMLDSNPQFFFRNRVWDRNNRCLEMTDTFYVCFLFDFLRHELCKAAIILTWVQYQISDIWSPCRSRTGGGREGERERGLDGVKPVRPQLMPESGGVGASRVETFKKCKMKNSLFLVSEVSHQLSKGRFCSHTKNLVGKRAKKKKKKPR